MEENKIIEQNTFLGYVNNDSQIGTSAYSLVEGTQNTLIIGNDPQNYSVETRNGYVQFGKLNGSGSTIIDPITSSYDRFANRAGKVIPVASTNSDIYLYYAGKWNKFPVSSGIVSNHEKYFTEWWDDVSKQNYLLWVNGGNMPPTSPLNNGVSYWKGEIAEVSSLTTTTITTKEDLIGVGFNPGGGSIVILRETVPFTVAYTYTGISGNTFTGVSPDPTTLLQPGDVILTTTWQTDASYDGCNKLSDSVVFDITNTFKNHVFYGSYNSKNVYFSNSFFNFDPTPDIINSTLLFNDIQVTGTPNLTCDTLPSPSNGNKKIKIEFDGVSPSPQIINTGLTTIDWNISLHSSNTRNKYQVKIVNVSPLEFQTIYDDVPVGPVTPVLMGTTFSMPNGVTFEFTTDNPLFYSVDTYSQISVGANDTYSWYTDIGDGNGYVLQGSGINTSTSLVVDGITYKFGSTKGHKIHEYIEYQSQANFGQTTYDFFLPFNNFYSSKPQRRPGEGGILTLDSAPVAFIVQEDAMYINGQGGEWYEVIYQLSDDGKYENVIPKRLKSAKVNKVLRMANICHTRNDVIFVSTDKNIESIGRVVSVDTLPQTVPLSDPIKKDTKSSVWYINQNGKLNGHCIHYDDKTFFTDPATQTIFIYDHIKGFWQPPQKGIPVSRFAIIEGKLCGHSALRVETYQLFTGTNDNGGIIEAKMRLSYNQFGTYSTKKNVQRLFTAGFKNDRSNLTAEVLFGYNGCEGKVTRRIDPIMCISRDDVSIGQANLAYHGHANKKQPEYNWFEHMEHFDPHSNFYTVSIGYFDNSMDGYFRIVCTGLDASTKNAINHQQISKEAKTQEPPDIIGIPNNFGKSNYINQPDYVDTIFYSTVYNGDPWTGGSDGGGVPGDGDPI